MKVYAVIFGDDWQAGHWVYGVYTNSVLANTALKELQQKFPYPDECFIEEQELDKVWDNYAVPKTP